MRNAIVLVLGLAVAAGLLLAFGLVDLPGREATRGGRTDETLDPLAAGAPEGGAELHGRPEARPGATPTPTEPEVIWEVAGSRADGARLWGRVVLADGGVPVAGALVRLFEPDIVMSYLRVDPAGRFDVLQATTGRDGRFSFQEVVPSAEYVVRVRAPGHAAVTAGPFDLRGPARTDVGDLEVGPQGAMEGRVVDAEGRPLEDVRVATAWQIVNPMGIVLTDPDTLPEIEAEMRTGADGRFRLEGLEPGRKTLVLDGGAYGSTAVWRVDVADGEVADAGDVVLAGVVPLAGTLRWEGEGPIAGARVFAGRGNEPAVATVTTDAEGRWRVPRVPEGRYMVGVLVPGMHVRLFDDIESGRTDVDLTLPAPGTIQGTVVLEDGSPVVAFGVTLDAVATGNFAEMFANRAVNTATGPAPFTDPRGRFTLRALPGSYQARVSAEGHPSASSDPFEIDAGGTVELKIVLREGFGGSGLVVDERGTPIPGAWLLLMPQGAGPERWTPSSLRDWAEERDPVAVTDAEGRFAFPPQTPGRYHLIAVHPTHEAAGLRGVDLTGGAVEGLRLALPRAGALEGRVLDDAGAPAAEAEIALVCDTGDLLILDAEADGTFRQEGLPGGRWLAVPFLLLWSGRVRAVQEAGDDAGRAAAFEALRDIGEPFEVNPDHQGAVVLRLPRRTLVETRITVGGAPSSSGVWILPQVEGSASGRWLQADERGQVEIRLLPGTYWFYVPGPDQVWRADTVVVPEGGEARIEIQR